MFQINHSSSVHIFDSDSDNEQIDNEAPQPPMVSIPRKNLDNSDEALPTQPQPGPQTQPESKSQPEPEHQSQLPPIPIQSPRVTRSSTHLTPAEIVRQKQMKQLENRVSTNGPMPNPVPFTPNVASTPIRNPQNARQSIFQQFERDDLSPIHDTEQDVEPVGTKEKTPEATPQPSQPPPIRQNVSSRLPVFQRIGNTSNKPTATNVDKTPVSSTQNEVNRPPVETPKTTGETNIATTSRALAANIIPVSPAKDTPATAAPVITLNMNVNNTPTYNSPAPNQSPRKESSKMPQPGSSQLIQPGTSRTPEPGPSNIQRTQNKSKNQEKLLTDDENDTGNETNDSNNRNNDQESPRSSHNDSNRSRRQLFQSQEELHDGDDENDSLPKQTNVTQQRSRNSRVRNFYDVSKVSNILMNSATTSKNRLSLKNGTYDITSPRVLIDASSVVNHMGQTYDKSRASLKNHTYDVHTSTKSVNRNTRGNSIITSTFVRETRCSTTSQTNKDNHNLDDDSERAADAEVARVTGYPSSNRHSDRSSISSTNSSSKENNQQSAKELNSVLQKTLRPSTSNTTLANQRNTRSAYVRLSPLPKKLTQNASIRIDSLRIRPSETFSSLMPPQQFRDEVLIHELSPNTQRRSIQNVQKIIEMKKTSPLASTSQLSTKRVKRRTRKRQKESDSDEHDDVGTLSQSSGRRKLYTKGHSDIEDNQENVAIPETDDFAVTSSTNATTKTSPLKTPQKVTKKSTKEQQKRVTDANESFRKSNIAASSTMTNASASHANDRNVFKVPESRKPSRSRKQNAIVVAPADDINNNGTVIANGVRRSTRTRKVAFDFAQEMFAKFAQQEKEKRKKLANLSRSRSRNVKPDAKRARTTSSIEPEIIKKPRVSTNEEIRDESTSRKAKSTSAIEKKRNELKSIREIRTQLKAADKKKNAKTNENEKETTTNAKQKSSNSLAELLRIKNEKWFKAIIDKNMRVDDETSIKGTVKHDFSFTGKSYLHSICEQILIVFWP